MSPRDTYRSIEDKIVLKYASTSPGSSVRMSRPISKVFPKRGSNFLPNEKYYVGVMYGQTLPSGMVVYGEPQLSENALFVPAGQISGLEPGEEIHWH